MLIDPRGERRILPRLYRAGRDHIGVAGEAQDRTFVAANRPEVFDVLDVH